MILTLNQNIRKNLKSIFTNFELSTSYCFRHHYSKLKNFPFLQCCHFFLSWICILNNYAKFCVKKLRVGISNPFSILTTMLSLKYFWRWCKCFFIWWIVFKWQHFMTCKGKNKLQYRKCRLVVEILLLVRKCLGSSAYL